MTQHGGPRPGQAKIGAVGVNIPRSVGCMRCTRDARHVQRQDPTQRGMLTGNVRDFGFDVRVGRVPVLIAYESRPDSCG